MASLCLFFLIKYQAMIINWYGGGCYKVQVSDFSLVVDPESSSGSGSRLKGDLVIKTSALLPQDNYTQTSHTEIIGPGEYEISGVKVKGAKTKESGKKELKSCFRVVIDDIKLGFLGNISEEPDEDALEVLSDVDILFIPSNKVGARLVKTIEPKIVIPGWGDPQSVKSEFGQEVEPQDKLTIKRKDVELIQGTKLVILES